MQEGANIVKERGRLKLRRGLTWGGDGGGKGAKTAFGRERR